MDMSDIGRRLREIRSWRRMSLRVTAELSGISYGYLAKLERGEKAVNSRKTLEALANALRVSPVELTGKPYVPVDRSDGETVAAIQAVEDAVAAWWLGDVPEGPRRPWPEVRADLDRLNRALRPRAAYREQAELLPPLLRELLAAAADPALRRSALMGLIGAYKSVAYVGFDLGIRALPILAADRMHQAAESLGDPEVVADVAWRRAQLLSGGNRSRQYELAAATADSEAPYHVRGMAHLVAALAAATQGREDVALGRLDEAEALARVIDTDDRPWTRTDFTRTNVGIWRVSIAVELGYGAKVAEVAASVRPPETLPVPHRQAAFWIDFGRALLAEPRYRDRGIAALLRAEQLAPQKVRANAFAREAVANALRRVRRDAEGRELRALAWRMGVAPVG
nr:helix-turn-helix transcriptional regulator [Amycolatopsis arida]